ncbi:Uncharacterised protein [BD1-7 clade bacterium]|uniref:Uncharacterized protein n=1 Tax=BD1-7 clade bacterium TaxID=2029982 RepID=A0A5S9QUD6_9GAMM|nr:Uncharacterised protein [BD1-7 clade bacterium]
MSELIKLIMLLLVPLILPAILLVSVFWSDLGFCSAVRRVFVLNPDSGLIHQGLLWLGVVIPVAYFFALGFVAWDGYELSVSQAGFATFVKISTLPLSILALSLPLTVLVARFHGTEQAARQIDLTKLKNNMDAFYSHRKEFFEYFELIDDTDYFGTFTVPFRLNPKIHRILFIGSPEKGMPTINNQEFEDLDTIISSARNEIHQLINSNHPPSVSRYDWYMLNTCVTIHHLLMRLGLTDLTDRLSERSVLVEEMVNSSKEQYLSVGNSTDDLVAAYRYINDVFDYISDFSGYTRKETPDTESYLNTGGKFRKISDPGIVEQIHNEDINAEKVLKIA